MPSPFLSAHSSLQDDLLTQLRGSTAINGFFVNMGVHSVPLFSSPIPPQVLSSCTPYRTVCELLRKHVLHQQKQKTFKHVFSRLMKWSPNTTKSTTKGNQILPGTEDTHTPAVMTLSKGCSAIIRIFDTRTAAFMRPHIQSDAGCLYSPDTTVLDHLLSIAFPQRHRTKHQEFIYDSLKFDHEPDFFSLLPNNLKPERKLNAMSTAINQIYVKKILNFGEEE